jgi:imidazolonepropionase-like amidohydrolase
VKARTLLLLALAAPGLARAEREPVVAVVGARIVTLSGAPIEAGTLVMRGGLIESVGTQAAPPDARVIEGKGLVLTPGLIDGFGGTGLPAAPPRGAPGAPSPPPTPDPLAPEADALDRLRPADALKARDDGVTTALAIPREGVLPGRSVLLNLSGEQAEGMVWRQPFALHVHMTSLARRYPGSLMGTMAMVRQGLLDGTRYRLEWAAYEKQPAGRKRPRYDASLRAWAEVAAGELPVMVTAQAENDVRRALSLADEFKVRVLVAGAPQAFRVADLVKSRRLPLLVSVNFDPPRAPAGGPFGGSDEEREREEIAEAERNPAELHKAGVAFALVSGHAPRFLAGVQKAIERGLPREAALRAVTLGAAEALGIADRTGSLEKGKMANVVAWSGDPLAKEAKVKMVFVDGQLYEPDERPEREGGPR